MVERASFIGGPTEVRALLTQRLAEPPSGRVQLLAGPRQVGKTTLLLALSLKRRTTSQYLAADSPEASLPAAWERLWQRAEEIAKDKGRATVFLDEVHLFSQWSQRLKAQLDRVRRFKLPIHVVATGSSALLMGEGLRESLAGRFERLTLSHWSVSEAKRLLKLGDKAADIVVRYGSYPGALPLRRDALRFRAYMRDAIIEPAISKDVLALALVKKPALLRQVFAVASSSPAQIVSLQKLQGQLQDKGALETLRHYLELLEEAFLVASLPKLSTQEFRQRASPPKLVVLNNALITTVADSAAHVGAAVENACLASAWNAGQTVRYWREEPHEVDGVLDGSWGSWAMEVKTGPYGLRDLTGLFECVRRWPRYTPLVVCDAKHTDIARAAGARAMSWQAFLLRGPTSST